MHLIPGKVYNAGDGREIDKEQILKELSLQVTKFNNRNKPSDVNKITLFPSFSEFGSEIVTILYCIPYYLRHVYPGAYAVAAGWHGRSFLYKHIVDEFWELSEADNWLRNYCRAFHHASRNLLNLEKKIWRKGKYVTYDYLAHLVMNEIYPQITKYKELAAWPKIPAFNPSVEKYLSPNSIGITARNRVTYGRNLPYEFYVDLVKELKNKGYDIVWLGEKVSTYPCPEGLAIDFRESEEAKNLENTISLVSKLKFTIQFYTASSRLAGLIGTPFIIFESPDQLWGQGQEGIRLELCSKGPKKIVASDFRLLAEDSRRAINGVLSAIEQIGSNNYEDDIQLVVEPKEVEGMRSVWREKYKI